jgi:aerobic-type carbon monoxide dehydrogenase small subunit (CoxS/CutS family)
MPIVFLHGLNCESYKEDFTMSEGEKTAKKISTTPLVTEALIRLIVNGETYELTVKANWSLQYVLHDRLGFTSVKDMCGGRGECGSCTTIVNNRPVLSCMTLAIECNGKNIETAEGIVQAGHPLIEAYARNHCMQCGYCTPGFVVTAKALLDRNSNPTENEVRESLKGNLCRCGTYPRHPIAVLEVAKELSGEA